MLRCISRAGGDSRASALPVERVPMRPEEFSCQILIADRNPHVRTYLQRELLKQGYRVLLARS